MRSLPGLAAAIPVIFLFASRALAQAPEEPASGEPPASDNPDESAEGQKAETAAEKAKSKPKTPLPGENVSDSEPEPPLIEAAPDLRSGHLYLTPSAALSVPFGKLASGTSQSSQLATGPGFGLDLGLGISRSVVLGAWGQLVKFGEGDDCGSCSATSIGVGGFIRYHLVQGVRFDPWMSAGLGYRTTSISNTTSGDVRYSGLEFLRLQLGGDWYPSRYLGFGPFFELDSGVYTSRPDSSLGTRTHLQFLVGLRFTFDMPGRGD